MHPLRIPREPFSEREIPTFTGFTSLRPKSQRHGGSRVIVHRFDNSRDAKSWRRNHRHPIFSADGHRIYFNFSEGEFTRLIVAEIALAR